jgi:hypothetical protein
MSSKPQKPMQASKWLQVPILIDAEEIRSLFEALGEFQIFLISCICKPGEETITREQFLERYAEYISALQKGELPDDTHFRHYFSSAFTVSPDLLYALDVGEDQRLIRIAKPVIQLQMHRMDYSTADAKFRSMTFGEDTISWGIQFSYPQLFEDSETHEVHQVGKSADFPNTQLFHSLQRWMRQNTVPTPVLIGEHLVNIPMRLGKKCFGWINKHPQLRKKGLQISLKNL